MKIIYIVIAIILLALCIGIWFMPFYTLEMTDNGYAAYIPISTTLRVITCIIVDIIAAGVIGAVSWMFYYDN